VKILTEHLPQTNEINRTKSHTFASRSSQPHRPKLAKECAFPTPKKFKNKKFPSLQKNKTLQPHSPRQTDTNIHGRRLTALYLRTLNGVTDDRTPACNTGACCTTPNLNQFQRQTYKNAMF